MSSRLAIYNPGGVTSSGPNPFGKDVANAALFRALAVHGGFEQIDLLLNGAYRGGDFAERLLAGSAPTTRLVTGSILDPAPAVAAGALLRGKADLSALAWHRQTLAGNTAYSLLGLIHTLGPPAIRSDLAGHLIAPVQPWDALICTSPSVREGLHALFDDMADHIERRFGARSVVRPHTPLIPLGVDVPAIRARADRPDHRAFERASLGVGENDVLILWVGRLSFYEKAFPQPMFRAVEEAARACPGRRMVFAMAGWFPDERDRSRYEAAARAYGGAASVVFLDGNDAERLERLWAAADIFLSLVDNIQETFGITPIEAMAAGLPLVVSDWNGYRSTVRDGVDGVLVPTLGGRPGAAGRTFAARQALELDSYQTYAGLVAQHTAVDVGHAARALAELAGSPDLRRRMGQAGRRRAAETFDWPVVVKRYVDVLAELAAIRGAAPPAAADPRPAPGHRDPFALFAEFASSGLEPTTRLRARAGVGVPNLERAHQLALNDFGAGWRLDREAASRLLDLVLSGRTSTLGEALDHFPLARAQAELTIVWFAKLGLLDWSQD